MKVKVGVSNRHVHLCEEDLNILFGHDLTKKSDLKQFNQFACFEVVSIKTDKSVIDNVRVLGPIRNYTQVEISKTDAYNLGINPPLRDSGDLIGSEVVTIVGPCGSVTKECCILVRRHIHITSSDKIKYNLPDVLSVKVDSCRGGIMDNVYVKVSEDAFFELHIDTDEANAFLLKNDDEVIIIDKK